MLKRTDIFPAKVSHFRMKANTVKLVLSSLLAIVLVIELLPASTPSSTGKVKAADKKAIDVTKTVSADSQVAKNMDKALKDNHFSGTALVVKDNKVVMHQGYGKANVAKNKDNGPNTTYPIASTAKFLTAVLVGEEVEKGKLSYDTKLSDYYPELPNANEITVRDLLTMTSGLRQPKQPQDFTSDLDNIDFSAHNTEKIADPGTGIGWTYQPVNYRLLAGILMKVTHKSFNELMDKAFNKDDKLGIGLYPDFKKDKNLAQAYVVGTDNVRDVAKVEYQRETGTGNVSMTTGQLFRLYQDFFQKKLVKNPKKLLEQHLPAHYTSGLYGYGDVYEGHGIFSGYESNVVISKGGKNAVILLSNQYDGDHSAQGLGQQFFKELTGQDAP
ncbi:beta-lactamase family protein [Fructobacillus sp. M2-14]|uniref:Beta-lactamase family protein n=1 Tax=Fructobacillus broussonetiae TaxID=2713173 RepID=A0ABS5R0C4_9LACO|nr:serine hydrolase domain-containing protein [Fructobacillus broussonetiae]MBS9338893.1 beta-lactamase family protein [Fructobacillus broussonetiae]